MRKGDSSWQLGRSEGDLLQLKQGNEHAKEEAETENCQAQQEHGLVLRPVAQQETLGISFTFLPRSIVIWKLEVIKAVPHSFGRSWHRAHSCLAFRCRESALSVGVVACS